MTKLMLSLGDQTFRTLALEANSQDVTVQQLVRALIVPEGCGRTYLMNRQAVLCTESSHQSPTQDAETLCFNPR